MPVEIWATLAENSAPLAARLAVLAPSFAPISARHFSAEPPKVITVETTVNATSIAVSIGPNTCIASWDIRPSSAACFTAIFAIPITPEAIIIAPATAPTPEATMMAPITTEAMALSQPKIFDAMPDFLTCLAFSSVSLIFS